MPILKNISALLILAIAAVIPAASSSPEKSALVEQSTFSSDKNQSVITTHTTNELENKRENALFQRLMSGFNSNVDAQEKQNQQPEVSQLSLRLRPRIVSLNIMVAGLSGLGKTTSCASLLQSWLAGASGGGGGSGVSGFGDRGGITITGTPKSASTSVPGRMTKHIDPSRQFERYDAKENTLLRVRIIDTPGFGNKVIHWDAIRPISRYIQTCRERQYRAETATSLPGDSVEAFDDLVHVCLYFLPPGRILEMDVQFLKRIQREVVIVPIIAKADTLTDDEVSLYRQEIVEAFRRVGIVSYNFDYPSHQLDKTNKVVSHSHVGAYSRGRRPGEALAIVSRDGLYTWGSVRSFDPKHSDLALVRDLLLSGHTETFIEMAKAKYGTFRANKIRRHRIGEVLRYMLLAFLAARSFGILSPLGILSLSGGTRAQMGVLVDAIASVWRVIRNACSSLLASLKVTPVHTPATMTSAQVTALEHATIDTPVELLTSSKPSPAETSDQRPSFSPFLGVFGHID